MLYLLHVFFTIAPIMPGTEQFSFPLDWLGAGRYRMHPITLGHQMPTMADVSETVLFRIPQDVLRLGSVQEWSCKELPDWKTQGKVTAPRIVLAKLAMQKDVEQVNQYLQQSLPWSGVGSSWFLHRGDYDFSLVTLTTILYLFGNSPELLYPETKRYLIEVLLNQEGGTPLVTVPLTFGLVLDTENHHLMTEGSRYLKNQWLFVHGSETERNNPMYDNRNNGLDAWINAYLDAMIHEGIYEFNSRPYSGYTIQSLLNLEAFPENPTIRQKARYILDIMNLQYALGSLGLRRNPPFRRRYDAEKDTNLNSDPHTAYMRAWVYLESGDRAYRRDLNRYSGHALLAELLPYRLPYDLYVWTIHKPESYFVRFGRGAAGCPEIYSGGPGYLLSSGGANRGLRSHIVARPITLLLEDDASDLRECIYLKGQGPWYKWNTTGVYERFACSNGPVHIPTRMERASEKDGWCVLQTRGSNNILIAIYSQNDFSCLAIFSDYDQTPEDLLLQINTTNPFPDLLQTKFCWPDGRSLEYDVHTPKGRWVMIRANGEDLDRHYDAWPQCEGKLPALSFSRTSDKNPNP